MKHNENIMRKLAEWPKYKQIKRIDERYEHLCKKADERYGNESAINLIEKKKELYTNQKMNAHIVFGKMFNEFNKRQKSLAEEVKAAQVSKITSMLLDGRF